MEVSTSNSSSKIKFPYSCSVARKELGWLRTVVPTISPFFTSYFAFPFSCFQPCRSLPLKSFCHPLADCAMPDIVINNVQIKKMLFRFISVAILYNKLKIRSKDTVLSQQYARSTGRNVKGPYTLCDQKSTGIILREKNYAVFII